MLELPEIDSHATYEQLLSQRIYNNRNLNVKILFH